MPGQRVTFDAEKRAFPKVGWRCLDPLGAKSSPSTSSQKWQLQLAKLPHDARRAPFLQLSFAVSQSCGPSSSPVSPTCSFRAGPRSPLRCPRPHLLCLASPAVLPALPSSFPSPSICLMNISISRAQLFPLNKQSADFIAGLLFTYLFGALNHS